MANETFQLVTVTRALEGEVELMEALGVPEVSALGTPGGNADAILEAKARAILEDADQTPPFWVHRRHIPSPVELDSVEVTFNPPKRNPAWQEPVRLRLEFVRWVEGELHHAYVPAARLRVFAPRASLLGERVEQHLRLRMAALRIQNPLGYFAQLEQSGAARLGEVEVVASLKTAKQIASEYLKDEKTPSALASVAEEWPAAPFLPESVRGKGADSTASVPVAFEVEAELRRLSEEWSRPRPPSLLLIGPAGCGKTVILQELARRRAEFGLGTRPFWSTTGARLMSGQIGFGMWQERCQKVCREISQLNGVLHLGQLAELVEVGKTRKDQQSVGGFLRAWIARGDIVAVAECTPEQFGALERLEPQLVGAFQHITIAERTPAQTRAILTGVFDAALGKPPERAAAAGNRSGLDWIHRLHQRYAAYSANPARPVRFLRNLLADRFPEKGVTETDVLAGFSRETGLPAVLLDDRVRLDLDATHEWFTKRVAGQPDAVTHVVDLLATVKARLSRPRKPLASFLFIGPTGTGKTEMAKTLAEFLFGDANRLVRFDLNQFGDPVSVLRLIGSSLPGAAEGLLTSRVREQPFSVLLLDEFEKADPSFFDLLLQILGDGRLTDGSGRVADFCNCVIVMTSNLGAQAFQTGAVGFGGQDRSALAAREHFTTAVRKFLRPEIFNRLDAVVPFSPLPLATVRAIAERMLENLRQREGLLQRPLQWSLAPEVIEHLARRGYDVRYGARPLKRAIERELLAPLSESLNQCPRSALRIECEVTVESGRLRIETRSFDRSTLPPAQQNANFTGAKAVGDLGGWRRRIGTLRNAPLFLELENRLTLLEAAERRKARLGWKDPARAERVVEIQKLKGCVEGVTALLVRSEQSETAAALAFFRDGQIDQPRFAKEIEELGGWCRRWSREVFRTGRNEPNEVVLVLFAEQASILMDFANAYREVAEQLGELVGLEYFVPQVGGRARHVSLPRVIPKKLADFFAHPPAQIIGVAMHLRGDLFRPRFETEKGVHVLSSGLGERPCLVEVASPPLGLYQPPVGVDRPGHIFPRGTTVRRRFKFDESLVIDTSLGERPWNRANLAGAVRMLTEETLDQAVAKATSAP
ncbi:MAG TPA: AAA family ATPase [Candidatus Limnocylindria bacterium]|nr:AAA family ATPase [Candidatus Limnocylindria bacterium]